MGIHLSVFHELSDDFKVISSAFRLLFLLGISIIGLFLIFRWDAACEYPFSEAGPTEIIQTVLLLLSTVLLFVESYRYQDMRGALILAGGFIGCMLIREQDYFLDMLSHGCWKWPALTLAAGCLIYAGLTLRATISALARFIRWHYFPIFITGIVIVLAYSRLFGMGVLWKTLLPNGEWRIAKNAIEESSELLGYMLITASVLLLHFRKK